MRKTRKKFKNPRMSWNSEEIGARKDLIREFGLRRRKEILIAQEVLRNFRRRARELIAEQDEEKTKVLLDKLVKIGLLEKGQGLDDVLALSVNDILGRRLQTIVLKRGLATTSKQARQFITHGHVTINKRAIQSPSYIVQSAEEAKIIVHDVQPQSQNKGDNNEG